MNKLVSITCTLLLTFLCGCVLYFVGVKVAGFRGGELSTYTSILLGTSVVLALAAGIGTLNLILDILYKAVLIIVKKIIG